MTVSQTADIAKPKYLYLSGVLCTYYLCHIFYAIFSQRTFFADGPYNFIQMIQKGTFLKISPARYFANYCQEVFIVILSNLGITDITLLSYAHGFGVYFPQIASIFLCYLIVRKHDLRYMLFPILYLLTGPINGSFVIISEAHVIVSLFWPIFFYLTVKDNFNVVDSLLLTFCSLLFMRSYESAAILAPFLIAIIMTNLIIKWNQQTVLTKATYLTTSILLTSSFFIATNYIIHPTNPSNKARFLSSLQYMKTHIPFMMSCIYLLVISMLMLSDKFADSRITRYITIALVSLSLFVGLSPLLMPELAKPYVQFPARAYMTFLLPPTAVFAYLTINGRLKITTIAWSKIEFLTVILLLSQTTWQILATYQWNGFKKVFQNELISHSGVLKFDDSIVAQDRLGRQLINPMAWFWTNPCLSIVWSPHGEVNTIILNKPDTKWQPFDPLAADELPDLKKFGISYTNYVKHLSS